MDTIETEKSGHWVFIAAPTPTEKAEEAILQMAFDLVALEDALNAGAALSDKKKSVLRSFVARISRIGALS